MSIKDFFTEHKFSFLFIWLIIYFLASALLQEHVARQMFGLLFASVLLLSLLLVTDQRRWIAASAVILALSTVAVTLTGFATTSESLHIFQMILSLIFLFMIASVSFYETYHYKTVTLQTLYGAVCTYLFMGMMWMEAYMLLFHLDHSAFSLSEKMIGHPMLQTTFTYFSFVTISTLGYGDILPITPFARTLTWLEAVMGQVYITILIAQLVGQYIAQRRNS